MAGVAAVDAVEQKTEAMPSQRLSENYAKLQKFADFPELSPAQAAFVDAPGLLLYRLGMEGGFLSVALGAVGTGLQTVATFAPVVGFLFFCQILLEESGYMTRAAVVADRMMRRLGLSGRAFLPLILGFGCTIPLCDSAR